MGKLFNSRFLYSFYFAPGQITIEARAEIQGKLSPVFPEIIIDKIPQKKSATLSLPPGNHSILMKLQDKDYEPLEFPIYVPAGQKVKLEKHFVHRKGKVRLSSIVPPVEARFVNQKSGKKFYFLIREQDYAEHTLDVGEYEMTFQKENYFSQTKRVTIREKEVLSFPIHLEPMLLESWTLGEEQETKSIYLADVDGNGKLELLCFSPQGSITAYDFWKKARLWHIPYKLPEIAYHVVFHDIDRDGIPDFIIPHHHCFLVISGKTHRELFSLPSYWGRIFALVDANQDGYEDIILMRGYNKGIECYDSKTGKPLWSNGQTVGTFCPPVLLNQKNLLYARDGKLIKLDITNGKEDIYLKYSDNASNADDIRIVSLPENKQGILCYSEDEGLLCFDLISGKKLWHWKHHPQNIQAMTLADIDQDGKDEIFIHLEQLYCLDMSTGKVKWQFDTRNPKKLPREIHTEKWETAPLVADLDQDGSSEVVVYTPENKIYILNAQTGAKINEFSTTKSVQSLILFDANHDGQMEILFLAGNQVFCIRHLSEHRIRIFEKNNLSNAALALADFDDNGTQDIILGNREGEVFILDGQSWREIWHYKMPDPTEPISHPPIMADVCGDSRKEILIYAQKTIMAVSKEKQILWIFQAEDKGYNKLFFVADVNKDGRKEVIITTNHKGFVYCLNGQTGEKLWKKDITRLYSSPQICDLEGEGCQEILATASVFYSNLKSGLFYCLNARDGTYKWNPTPIPIFSEGGSTITLYDINTDGIPEIFVPQAGGHISCLDGKTGRPYWHQRLRGGDVKCLSVADFNQDGKLEVIVATANEDNYCLDAVSGKILWMQVLCENQGTVMDTDLGRSHVDLLNLQADLDQDGFHDMVMLNSQYFFSIFSGKDGRWLGHAQEYLFPKAVPHYYLLCDLNQDHRLDFLFVLNSRLICIYDLEEYLKKLIPAPLFASSPSQDASILRLSYFHKLFRLRAYERLEKELSQKASFQTPWQQWFYFYQGICALSREKESLEFFKKSQSLSPNFLDVQFMQALVHLNQNQTKEAVRILEFLMKNFPFDFHPLYLKYRHLLKNQGQNKLRSLLPSIIQKTEIDLKFYHAYCSAFYTNQNREADYFLELSLRYGLPKTPEHSVRLEQYIQKIQYLLEKIDHLYSTHERFFIKDHALEVIPDYASLLDEICKEK
ncbi:MAG: PQQ-binding-like beta-propeller repeat protein [Candidatus Brocadiae bacterium]|nr:PQQ-binding-like beta-propeller repeat protein [Candidatus Brocadiia bacterium]